MTGVQTCALPICFPVTICLYSVGDSVMNSVMNSVLFSVDEFTMEKLKLRLLQRRYGFLFVNLLGILLRILLNPLLRKN